MFTETALGHDELRIVRADTQEAGLARRDQSGGPGRADEYYKYGGYRTDLGIRRMSQQQKYGFRFMHLTDVALSDLRSIVKDEDGVGELGIRPQCGAPQKFAATWDLQEGADYGWIKRFVERHALEDDSYGVFVSLVTDHDRGRIRAPRFVIDLSRAVGGVIDFSFTVV